MTAPLITGDLVTTTWLNEVERRKPTGATVATSQTTTSTSYADLATVGPAVTVTTGTSALVIISADLTAPAGDNAFMSVAVSGASTVAAADSKALKMTNTNTSQKSRVMLITGLTAGSNTFTAKYRVGSGTGTFVYRELVVVPFD